MEKKMVLIAGAGPTGLTMANLFVKWDIPFLLIDKNPHPSKESKAFAVHARSLEVLDKIGAANKAIKKGNIDNTIHFIINGKEKVKFSLKKILPGETRFPYLLILEQNKIEDILAKELKEKGEIIHWNHELLNVNKLEKEVEAEIKSPENIFKKKFQYVIGCDGAGSTVRDKAEFKFTGKSLAQTFYLTDGELDWKFKHSDVYFLISPGHLTAVFSFQKKGHYRIFNFLNSEVNKKNEKKLSREEMQKILDSGGKMKMELKQMDWSSVFKIHTRYTQEFSKGRIFLAGDAAHIHSPAGGQGMNTGIQDAYNLAWKLGMVLKVNATPQLLQSYNAERHKIAENLHNTTDRFFRAFIKNNMVMDFFRQHIFKRLFRFLLSFRNFRMQNIRRISQISVKYRNSDLSQEKDNSGFSAKAPRAGDRAPFCIMNSAKGKKDIYAFFSYNQFTLLIATFEEKSTTTEKLKQYLENHDNVPLRVFCFSRNSNPDFFKTYGIKKEAMFLIRPDDHIAIRSSKPDLKIIEDYFARHYMI